MTTSNVRRPRTSSGRLSAWDPEKWRRCQEDQAPTGAEVQSQTKTRRVASQTSLETSFNARPNNLRYQHDLITKRILDQMITMKNYLRHNNPLDRASQTTHRQGGYGRDKKRLQLFWSCNSIQDLFAERMYETSSRNWVVRFFWASILRDTLVLCLRDDQHKTEEIRDKTERARERERERERARARRQKREETHMELSSFRFSVLSICCVFSIPVDDTVFVSLSIDYSLVLDILSSDLPVHLFQSDVPVLSFVLSSTYSRNRSLDLSLESLFRTWGP